MNIVLVDQILEQILCRMKQNKKNCYMCFIQTLIMLVSKIFACLLKIFTNASLHEKISRENYFCMDTTKERGYLRYGNERSTSLYNI